MCTAQLLMFLLAIFIRAHSAFLLSAVMWRWGKCLLEWVKHEPVLTEHISVLCPATGMNTPLSCAGPGCLSNAFCPFVHPWFFPYSSQDMGTKQPILHLMQEPPSLISPAALKSSPQPTELLQKSVIISIQGKALVWEHYREILRENECLRIFTSHYKKFYLCCFFLLLCRINKHDTLFYKVISFWIIEPQKKHIKPTNLIIFVFLKLKIDLNQVQAAIFPPHLRNYIPSFRLK